MRISLVAALARNRVIGRGNQLPWRLSADLKHFKSLTMGKPILMGRKTYESIGKPLPGRTNIVISRDSSFSAAGCRVVHSVEAALTAAEGGEEAMVIGGANLYEQLLLRADRLYLTEVQADINGDAWFPEINRSQWQELERESHQADENNEFDYDFVVLVRQ
ncbi:Dihydrofolate reductase [hydrothermal vent metagenome]|uniref:dihydrofolate reductase n=1 Tax=hydrothermal vent metagenome TaxID=652676 RepID=A0A3B0ZQK0_9ZZZZ